MAALSPDAKADRIEVLEALIFHAVKTRRRERSATVGHTFFKKARAN
jgi:hypothetical protein